MTFSEDWRDITDAYAATRAAATSRGSASLASAMGVEEYKQKSAMLRDIARAQSEYVKGRDRARLEEFKSEMRVRADAVKAQQALTRTLIDAGTKLTTAQLASNTQLAKQWQADMTKLATSYDSRGARWLTDTTARAYVGDVTLRENPGKLADIVTQTLKDSWDVEDPSTLGLYEAVSRQFGRSKVDSALPALKAAADRMREQRAKATAAAEKFQTLKIPPGGLTQGAIDEMVLTLGSVSLNEPAEVKLTTQEELESDTRYQELERQRKEAEAGLGAATGSSDDSYGGLGVAGAAKVLSDPKFRAWARDNGFTELGEMTDAGQYRFGKDAMDALSMASAEMSGEGRGDKGVEAVSVKARVGAPPDKFVLVNNEDGSVGAYVYKPDGSVLRSSFKEGEADVVVRGADGVADDAALAKMKEEVEDVEPSVLGVSGGKPMTASDLRDQVSSGKFDVEKLTDKQEELSTFDTDRTVIGQRLRHRVGDDPARTMRVMQDDGTTVKLTRKDESEPWTVSEGEVRAEQIDLSSGKVVRPAGESRILDALDVLRGKRTKASVDEETAVDEPADEPAKRTPVKPAVKTSPVANVPAKSEEISISDFGFRGAGSVDLTGTTDEDGAPAKPERTGPMYDIPPRVKRKSLRTLIDESGAFGTDTEKKAAVVGAERVLSGKLNRGDYVESPQDEAYRREAHGASPAEATAGLKLDSTEKARIIADLRKRRGKPADADIEKP